MSKPAKGSRIQTAVDNGYVALVTLSNQLQYAQSKGLKPEREEKARIAHQEPKKESE